MLRCRLPYRPRVMQLHQVNQTGDLTVIDHLPAVQRQQLQQLCSLRDSLYTKQFRQWIQHVTGCCELTDRVDCAANIYEAGCHLLCHDDVISTRHVSYIIYLSDRDWTQEDGGALELYPVAEGGNAPAARPSSSLLPSWNSMYCPSLPHPPSPSLHPPVNPPPPPSLSALFLVQPGVSFHSVQEVMNVDKKRISIQGWYHGSSPPAGSDIATIAQLTSARALNADAAVFSPVHLHGARAALTAEDFESLSAFISLAYLKPSVVKQLRQQFDRDGSVQLRHFIRAEYADKFSESVRPPLLHIPNCPLFPSARRLPRVWLLLLSFIFELT